PATRTVGNVNACYSWGYFLRASVMPHPAPRSVKTGPCGATRHENGTRAAIYQEMRALPGTRWVWHRERLLPFGAFFGGVLRWTGLGERHAGPEIPSQDCRCSAS